MILKEYARLESKWVILSRAFHENQLSFEGLEIHYKNILNEYFNYSLLNQKKLFESRSELIDKINEIVY